MEDKDKDKVIGRKARRADEEVGPDVEGHRKARRQEKEPEQDRTREEPDFEAHRKAR